MNFLGVTTAIVLDTRKRTLDGLYPIKLRITYERKSRYYGRNKKIHLPPVSKEDFASIMGSPRGDKKRMRDHIEQKKAEADSILSEMKYFEWELFDDRFLGIKKKPSDIHEYFQARIDFFLEKKKFSTASIYKSTSSAFKAFKGSPIQFYKVDEKFINGFKDYMSKEGKSLSTTSLYLRNLKAVFNLACEDGVVERQLNPFGKGKVLIEKAEDAKKAISKRDAKALFNYSLPDEIPNADEKRFSLDLWVFSFLLGGANLNDIFSLTWDNIHDDHIEFRRGKTKDSTRKSLSIVAPMMPEIREVISRQARSRGFLFPIEGTFGSAKWWSSFKNETKSRNKWMKRGCINLEIKPTTIGSARHTFSTLAKYAGLPQLFISEMMGHSKQNTTQGYMSGFGIKQKLDYMNELKEYVCS